MVKAGRDVRKTRKVVTPALAGFKNEDEEGRSSRPSKGYEA